MLSGQIARRPVRHGVGLPGTVTVNDDNARAFARFGWATLAYTLFVVLLFNFAFKVAVEVVMTPMTYLAVGALKRAENEDFYDRDTDFTPFSLRD